MNKCVFDTIFASNTLFMALKLILHIPQENFNQNKLGD